MSAQKILLAGATGYTGKQLLPLLKEHQVTAWLRENSPNKAEKIHWLSSLRAKTITMDLTPQASLTEKVSGTDCLISLLGTTKAQFNAQTSYESVDYGLNANLIKLAKAASIPRFILLSSIGAEKPTGAYLKIKKLIEDELRASGLKWLILRPSFITGKGRRLPEMLSPAFALMRRLSPKMADLYRPMNVAVLARVIANVIQDTKLNNCVLEGSALWKLSRAR